MKKSLVALVLSLALLLGASPASAQGITIVQLVDLFISLGIIAPDKADAARQAVSGMAGTGSTEPAQCYSFDTSFGIGAAGNDVVWLQTFLEREGFTIDDSEQTKGAPYGESTAAAVIKFQQKHGILPLTGYAGPITRAKLNSLYGCSGRPTVITPLQPTATVSVTSSPEGKGPEGAIYSFSFSAKGAVVWTLRLDCSSAMKTSVLYPQAPVLLGKGDTACGQSFTVESSNSGLLENFYLKIGFKSTTGSAETVGMTAIAYSSYDFGQQSSKIGGDRDALMVYPVLENQLTPVPTNPPVGVPSLSSVSTENTSEDLAGIWDNFGPGVGNANSTRADWRWKLVLTVPDNKNVKEMTLIANSNGEGWSTSARTDNVLGKKLYPLVVLVGDQYVQQNRIYDQSFGFAPGSYTLRLNGQKESESFPGGTLKVVFTDGTSATASVPAFKETANVVAPFITEFSGKAAGNLEMDANSTAYINGTNLTGGSASSVHVYIGGQSVKVISASETSVVVNTPADLVIGQSYDVYMSNAKGISNTVRARVLSKVIPISPTVPSVSITGSLSRTGDITINESTSLSWMTTGTTTGLNISIDLVNVATDVKTNYANTLSPSLGSYQVKLIPGFVFAGQSYKVVVNLYKAGVGLITSTTAGTFKAVEPAPVVVTPPAPTTSIVGSLSRTGDIVLNEITRLSWSTTGTTTGLNVSIDLENTATGAKTNYANTLSPSLGGYDVKLIPGFVFKGQSYKVNVNLYKAGVGLITSATAGTFKAIEAVPVVVTPPTLTVSSQSSTEDRAGVWDNFGPGPGNINKDPADWKWYATLMLPQNAGIASMEVTHPNAGETWSTSNPAFYPLVAILEKGQTPTYLTTGYAAKLGDWTAGMYLIALYGQRESKYFSGGVLTIKFTDGTSISATIPKMITSVSSIENQAGIISIGQVLELLRALR